MGALASLALGLGSSLLSSGVNALASNYSANKQNAYNKQLMQMQNNFNSTEATKSREWTEQFYNNYQSPSAMVQQYEDAGLNPALMYSKGSTGATSGTVGSSASASNSIASADPLGSKIFNSPYEALSLAQANNINADTNIKEKQGEVLDLDIETYMTKFSAGLALTKAETDNLIAKSATEEVQKRLKEAEIGVAHANAILAENEATLSGLKAEAQKVINQYAEEKQKLEIAIAEAEKEHIDSQVDELKAQAAKLRADTAGILKENDWIDSKNSAEIALDLASAAHGIAQTYLTKEQTITQKQATKNLIREYKWLPVTKTAAAIRDAGAGIGSAVGGIAKGAISGAASAGRVKREAKLEYIRRNDSRKK